MSDNFIIKDKKVLVIPDIHQNIEWAKAIIGLEIGNYDHIVFLGDEFDSFWGPPKVASVGDTARFVLEVQSGKYGPATQLLGNHNLSYMEAWRSASKFRNPKFLFNACAGYTNSKANEISKILTWNDWKKFKLFALCNGWLLTHAGLRANNFRPFLDAEKSLNVLNQEFNEAVNHINAFPHHLFVAGRDSGGPAAFGGPLWLRPNYFEDNEIPYPQIFGHTHTGKGVAKQYGRSFCIDGGQTTYAIIKENGELELKYCAKIDNADDILAIPYTTGTAEIQKWRTCSEHRSYVQTINAKIKAREKECFNDGLFPKITQNEWDKSIEAANDFDRFCTDKTEDKRE